MFGWITIFLSNRAITMSNNDNGRSSFLKFPPKRATESNN